MGFISDEFRREVELERRSKQQEIDRITQQAVSAFCNENNLARLTEEVKASVLDKLRNTQTNQIESTSIFDKPGMTYRPIHESEVCAEALKKFIKDVEPAISEVNIKFDSGYGDYEPRGVITVSFDPPLSL